jgi:tRNA G18 (ribose-2'-O)-methylase SpoU
MQGGVESLNVASAAAVAAFELLRRRRGRRPTPG